MKRLTKLSFKDEKGQSFVEFSLVLVFLLILVSTIVDLGWMFFNSIALRAAVQEAATYASICPDDSGKVRDRLRASASDPTGISQLRNEQIVVCILEPTTGACISTPEVGYQIKVSATYFHKIFTPLIGSFIGSQEYPITSTAQSIILRESCSP